jgi:hypothetical protein
LADAKAEAGSPEAGTILIHARAEHFKKLAATKFFSFANFEKPARPGAAASF